MKQVLPKWWRGRFLWVEFLLSVGLTLTAAFCLSVWNHNRVLDEALFGIRTTLYGVLATVWGALFGFVIATITIVLGFSEGARMKIVRDSAHYPDLWKTFMSATRALGFATAASLAGLLTDKDVAAGAPNHAVFYVVIFAAILATLRLSRCVWILQNVVKLVTAPRGEPTKGTVQS